MNRRTRRLIRLGLLMSIFAFAACHDGETQEAGDMERSRKEPRAQGERDTHLPPAKISMDKQIEGALADLAARTGVAEDTIKVREARSVQWGSGAMGCPKPGMNYTQALVPGVLLLLEVDGTIYHYHGAAGRSLFHCPAGRAQAPAYGQGQEVM